MAYKSKRLYNGNLRMIVVDISKDNHSNILHLASIDSNTFNLDSPAIVNSLTLPNYRQFVLPSSATEYNMYELSFQRLSTFLSLLNLELTTEENGKTFKELIDLGRQVKPVDGDAFYYTWFKFLLDSAIHLLRDNPDGHLIAIQDNRLDKHLKGKPYAEPKVMSAWNYLFALIWIVVDCGIDMVSRDIDELRQSIGLYGNASVYGLFRDYFKSL